MHPLPSLDNIAAAAAALDPVFAGTPLMRHDLLDARLGCRAWVKVETLNPIRSFKGRGASWYVHGLAPIPSRLVTASAGNFGQGLAYAAGRRALPVTVFAAENANPLKVAAMRRLGADVRLEGKDFDAAKDAAKRFAAAAGAVLVTDGDHPAIAEGAGTIAVELTRQAGRLDAVLVPLGNGALATGIGTWIKAEWPGTEVVAVAAQGAPAMAESWRAGRPVETETVSTIADGIAVRVPIPYALLSMRGTVDDVIAVDDATLIAAMRLVHEALGLVVEPAGVAGIAAVLAAPERFAGRSIATVLCGSNLTPAQMRDWLCDPSPRPA